jgi:hypothetical protein
MSRLISFLVVIALGLFSFACASRSDDGAEVPAPASKAETVEALQPGQLDAEARPSIDALIDDFVAAVGAKDMQTLTKLRVTETEYLDIIVPGGVPKGDVPRRTTPKVKDVFWRLLNDKSHAYAELFLARYGGHKYGQPQVTFTKPTRHYAWYDAYGKLRLQMVDEEGNIWKLDTGSIVAVAGRYKFVGYEYD